MNKWKAVFISVLVITTLVIFTRGPTVVEAASSPYDVPSAVKSGWDKNYGGKNYNMSTGKQLIYDIYSEKFTNGGYSIVSKDFGKGKQPYVRFQGWSVIFGHRHHTSSNHDTYIVAEDKSNPNNIKIYGAVPYKNLKATEDLEYNKHQSTSSTVWNKCSNSTRNVINTTCNMTYENVGFDAYLPINELFPDADKSKSWRLYIVKDVAGHRVYTPLNVPFDFSNLSHNGGDIKLSSGVDAKKLQMNSYPVIRRTSPRSSESGASRGYFSLGNSYTAVSTDESETAIWFGVRSTHDSNKTRWASSSYWTFGGDQATLSFKPENKPPTHISHSMTSTYKNGNDHWVQPGTDVTINLRQRDVDSGNKYQYIRLEGSGEHVRKRHSFLAGTTDISNVSVFGNTSSLSINAANRTENSSYGRVNWTVVPKTHGHSYDVKYHYTDLANNSYGYDTGAGNTGMKLRVDGKEPQAISQSISGAPYTNGNTYWVKSNDELTVQTRQRDVDSGNKYMYLRTLDVADSSKANSGNIVSRNRHDFFGTTTVNHSQVSDSRFVVNSVKRTENSTYGNLEWKVKANTHGSVYTVQHYYSDNVNNNTGYTDIGLVRVDDKAPNISYRNPEDTADFPSNSPTNKDNVTIKLKVNDPDSGLKRFRYGWSFSADTEPVSWTSWKTVSELDVSLDRSGGYYLHVHAEDNVGNSTKTQSGMYYAFMNQAPVASITFNPATVYNNTEVALKSNASDPDGDALTYQWSYQEPNSSEWVNFSTAANPSRIFAEKGNWDIRLVVSDGKESVTVTEVIPVVNRAPVAKFSWNPSTIYNDTKVTFINSSADADKDTMTYKWSYQAPNSTSWLSFSSAKEPSKVFNVKGEWKIRLVTSDGSASHTAIQSLEVGNRVPISNFSWSPETIYNNTVVRFSDSSSDKDGDRLNYQWAYQAPDSTTWVDFSTSSSPSKVFDVKGIWSIRLTVSDGTASHSQTKKLTVSNRAPIAEFNWSPSTIYNDTNVSFTNSSSDADKDSLSYQWAYQEPGTTSWVNFSTAQKPSKIFNKKGTWNVRLTVSDGIANHAVSKSLTVSNRNPVAKFNWSPSTIYNDTNVSFTNSSSDADKDNLTYQWAYQEPNSSTWKNFSTSTNPSKVFNKKGEWKVRLTVSDGSAADSETKSLTVRNREPVADFNWNPKTIYNDTKLTFSNASTDADKDDLSYQWAYREPGSTKWVNFSTEKNPSKVFNKKGNWSIRLITSDGTADDDVTKIITISNRAPKPSFNWNPSSVYTNTTVTFANNSSDADKDTLTYEWAYQKPGSTKWTNFSKEKTPSSVFGEKGNWNIRLTVSDGDTSTEITKILKVLNTAPEVTLNYAPNKIFEGDTVTLTAKPTDLDGDKTTVIFEENVNGTWKKLHQVESVNPGTSVTHQYVASPKTYQLRVRAIDDSDGVGTATVSFVADALEIVGLVKHTAEWEAIHTEAGHEADQFYAGERFLTEAVVTDHPIKKVTVSFAGEQTTGNLLTMLLPMVERSHPVYFAEVYDKITGDPSEHLAAGMVYFEFEAEWQNGVVKSHRVGVNVVSDVYGAFDFYRSN